ncbi:hypothetical protein SPRG_14443 [Saprolegnia parasitica CBS 223.65]|uniref:PHD-type domain-containing protein n=1 Tax=Saprolegnia parasitica (strain CBS 223.65) TaxID=695850 RepID=A0A067BPX9_SAPPC|nr:hypothetical protein SPRG_14443 [Saprolegnia parasitica CBS 223.65]KDO20308.1 hypothetical protein SPRG_14443 [Saprolegnia parasitica CBS 223.65]|eukprot:XP_012208977.1 hypothetical protein SPRG_14443 [Saprolegnia parasitica CBS 223.65]
MLSLKLDDGSALASRQTKAKFMTNLGHAMDRIVADTSRGGSTKDVWDKRSSGHEYDIAIAVLQKILKLKDAFNTDQRKVAEAYMESLVKSRVRSCRATPAAPVAAPTSSRRKSLGGKKSESTTLKRQMPAGPIVELPSGDICALCGDGGLILLCDGPCHRSFHMECVGLKAEPSGAKWLCPDCTAGKHMCMCCGKVGKMGAENGVTQCSMAKCGRFYHTTCVLEHAKVEWVGKKRFRCPSHYCHGCTKTKKKSPVVSCAHCAQAFHESCMRGMRILRLSTTMMICSEHLSDDRGAIVEGVSDDDDDHSVQDDDDDEDAPIARSAKKRGRRASVEVVAVDDDDDDDKPLAKKVKRGAKAKAKRKRFYNEADALLADEDDYEKEAESDNSDDEAPSGRRTRRSKKKQQLI